MAGNIDYKQKYLELKQKYKNSVDVAFRLGIEQGSQMAQQQQMQEQQQMQQEQGQGQEQGQPGQEEQGQEGQESEGQPQSAHPEGSELDQHISQLEGMVNKSELTIDDLEILKKSIHTLKFSAQMRKSDMSVKSIAKSMAPKPKAQMGENAKHNLNHTQKQAITMQEKIVSDIMAQWIDEENSAKHSITAIIANEGLKQ